MGLQHIPQETRFDGGWVTRVFNNTWGHLMPHKNVSYPGLVRFVLTDHSQYGCQPIILEYEFPNLEGPYIHDELFKDVSDWTKREDLKTGVIYERRITFRNYRFYRGKIKAVFPEMNLIY